ncbi:MAG: hypothetical protein HUU50_03910 [Candidatus Brocadiae bacterium]|nr:hypothetical protein [Candidatus Brocadiia bacterium]
MSDVLKNSGIDQEFRSKFRNCWSQKAQEYLLAYLSQKGVDAPLNEVIAFCEKQAKEEKECFLQETKEEKLDFPKADLSVEEFLDKADEEKMLPKEDSAQESTWSLEETSNFPQGNDPHEWETLEAKEEKEKQPSIEEAKPIENENAQESKPKEKENQPSLQKIAKKILQNKSPEMTAEEMKVWEQLASEAPEEKENSNIDPISAMAIEAKEDLDELDFENGEEETEPRSPSSFMNVDTKSIAKEQQLLEKASQNALLHIPPDETIYTSLSGTDSEFSLGEKEEEMVLSAQLATMSEIMICEQLGAISVQDSEEMKDTLSAMEVPVEEAQENDFSDPPASNFADQSSYEETDSKSSPKGKKGITEKLELLQIKVEKAHKLYDEAKKMADLEKYAHSIEKIKKCIKLFPGMKDFQIFKETLERQQREYKEKQRKKWNLQAEKCWEEKRFPEAIGKWNKSYELSHDPEIQEKISSAENCLQEAMQVWENAQLLVESNRIKEAIILLEECLQLYPYHGSALELLRSLKQTESKEENPAKAEEDNSPMDFEKDSEDLLFMPEEETPLETKAQNDISSKEEKLSLKDLMQTQRSSVEKKLSSTRRSTLSNMLEQLQEQREKMRQEKAKKQEESEAKENVSENEKKEKALRQKKQLDKIYHSALEASKKQNYKEALQQLQKIADRQWLCEVPDIAGDIQQIKKLLSMQSLSRNAQQKLDIIADSLKFYEVEKASELLEDKIFQEDLESSMRKKWQGMVNNCMKAANKRAWTRKILSGIILLLLFLMQSVFRN